MIKRYVCIHYAAGNVLPDAFANEKEAWRAIVEHCRGTDKAPSDWDIVPVSVDIH